MRAGDVLQPNRRGLDQKFWNFKGPDAMAEYRAALEMDENSKEAREGRDKAEKLYKRSKEVDYYKLLNVSRSASSREIKRAYHKLAVECVPAPPQGAGPPPLLNIRLSLGLYLAESPEKAERVD